MSGLDLVERIEKLRVWKCGRGFGMELSRSLDRSE